MERRLKAASLYSLSLWERVGVRADQGRCITSHPHPACGHPLPEGEGLMERRLKAASLYSLSLWERVGVRADQGRCITSHPHPACGHPLPEGEGFFMLPLPLGEGGGEGCSGGVRGQRGMHSLDDSRLFSMISR